MSTKLPRERANETLELVAEGYTHQEISTRLLIAESTVWNRLRTIYQWLGARNAPHAVALWLANGRTMPD